MNFAGIWDQLVDCICRPPRGTQTVRHCGLLVLFKSFDYHAGGPPPATALHNEHCRLCGAHCTSTQVPHRPKWIGLRSCEGHAPSARHITQAASLRVWDKVCAHGAFGLQGFPCVCRLQSQALYGSSSSVSGLVWLIIIIIIINIRPCMAHHHQYQALYGLIRP